MKLVHPTNMGERQIVELTLVPGASVALCPWILHLHPLDLAESQGHFKWPCAGVSSFCLIIWL